MNNYLKLIHIYYNIHSYFIKLIELLQLLQLHLYLNKTFLVIYMLLKHIYEIYYIFKINILYLKNDKDSDLGSKKKFIVFFKVNLTSKYSE